MEALFGLPFNVFVCPNLKLRKPSWIKKPSAMFVFALILVSYFLVTGGVIYDVIVEPPSIGSTTDASGRSKPVAFMAYRINGQYIMEGLASSFMFLLGGCGFIILDQTNKPNLPKLNRIILLTIGLLAILVGFFVSRVFIKFKLPSYLGNQLAFHNDFGALPVPKGCCATNHKQDY